MRLNIKKRQYIFLLAAIISNILNAQQPALALLKYSGGGDWYANPTSLPNLTKFCNDNLGTTLNPAPATVEAGSAQIFNYPFIHITGHGNILFNAQEVQNLRNYLIGGGFLHIDDNYGLDVYIRREMKKVFPELDFIELPRTHAIYQKPYNFTETGLPKIHEHDNKRPQGFALIYSGRVVCFYTYECDLGDGWEDPAVHNETPQAHRQALQMGANIIRFAFTQK
ncbi:MAG: DUF4159 domain-containing protein [Bacteroidales bacterium]|jgi:hypothetical protein|nr:DUF4159 domain-containing protein [Bacteroidales bacterium]